MSGDMLVMNIVEYGALDSSKEISPRGALVTAYVYYDYKTKLFGVCVEYKKPSSGRTGNFSYYSDNKDVLLDLLLDIITDFKQTEVALMNYKDMPKNPDDITFEMLDETDADEIMCYAYNQDFDDDDESNDGAEDYPSEAIKKYLNIIEAVFNAY
jgi:hypothetical protein